MNILPMRYFIAVVNNGGISAAARELYITQQTLSAHIAAMEKELECRLFERKPELRLTQEGRVFYDYCNKMVKLDESMHQEFREMKEEPSGVLRIGISMTRSHILMPEVIRRWIRKYPKIRIQIIEAKNEEFLPMLMEDKVDIIIGNILETAPEMEKLPIYSEQMLLLIPREDWFKELIDGNGDIKAPQMLVDYPFILHEKNDIVGRYAHKYFRDNNVTPSMIAMSDNAETCIDICADGIGLYMCPDMIIDSMTQSYDNIRRVPLDIHYTISAAYSKNRYQSVVMAEFIDTFRKTVEKTNKKD